ncbi:tetratricopeptide repeat protein [Micromonospora cathayae]|uniref:Tetratricopeptide repeat protein n=1 Tax=Micromonospora cathayae TaxID=3028804 RepID=A0ABY8A0E3_9ACTN|nr:tetratricopeptide repeat protein [Micromonospora sp. HUAS 3]WDZ87728.1 tetratricopeptide repeat protein [Micromonospora sp. HUAS 3]
MSSPFGELTAQAHHLVASGDLSGAQELLADALADADPRPANATPELADAAGLQARVLVTLGEPHSARGWAAFAYAAMTRLYGPSDQRTVAAAATLAAVLHRVGSYARAARLYQDVIIELTALDGPESLRVLAAHADLATVEYARGECTIARERLQDAWELHREVYGDGHVSGIKMLARLGAMQRDCGHFADAHDNLALARELCRQYLAPDDPLATQVAVLARAAANPDHACDDGPDAPTVPAARTPSADEELDDWSTGPPAHPSAAQSSPVHPSPASGHDLPDPAYPVAGQAHPDPTTYPTAVPHPRPPADPSPYPPGADPYPYAPGSDRYTADPGAGYAADAGADRYAADVDPYPGGEDPGHRTADRSYAHERRFDFGGRYGDTGPDDDRTLWPPEADVVRPGEEATTTTRTAEPALPPAVVGLTGSYPEESAGVRRVAHLPVRAGSRLPVHVPRPAADPPRRLAPLVVAGVVVVLLGTGAVIAGVAQVDDPADPAPAPAPGTPTAAEPSGTKRPTAPPGAAPSGVTLRDNRDSVALSWAYPAGAEGPVVVSGGRTGQNPRAFQELPAGSTSYIVYGLDRDTDYCFTVAVVHSADTVGRAKPVCTKRS